MAIGASGVTTVVAAALVEEEQNTGTDRVTTQVQGMVGILAMDHHLNKNLAIQPVVQVRKNTFESKFASFINFIYSYTQNLILTTEIYTIVNAGWGSWSSYSGCSKNCGGGVHSRSRVCNNPVASCGGSSCTGSTSQTSSCNTHTCPGMLCFCISE